MFKRCANCVLTRYVSMYATRYVGKVFTDNDWIEIAQKAKPGYNERFPVIAVLQLLKADRHKARTTKGSLTASKETLERFVLQQNTDLQTNEEKAFISGYFSPQIDWYRTIKSLGEFLLMKGELFLSYFQSLFKKCGVSID